MSDPQGTPGYGTPDPGPYGPPPGGYPPPGYGQPPYGPPPGYGYAPPPMASVPGQVMQTSYGAFVIGPKSKMTAGLLGIFLGAYGVGRFYKGDVGLGVTQLIVTIVTCGIGAIWGLIDGILILTAQPGSPNSLDSNGYLMS